MMKLVVTFSLLFSILGSLACSMVDMKVSDFDTVETIDQQIMSSFNHDCPQSGGGSHQDGVPCGEHCHHHGHCHCSFLVMGAKLSCPTSSNSHGMHSNTFHPKPFLKNLFRPPIV